MSFSGRKEHMDMIREKLARLGGTLSPFAAWIILTGIRTLPLRVERHSRNGMAVPVTSQTTRQSRNCDTPVWSLIRGIWSPPGSTVKKMGTAGWCPCGCMAENPDGVMVERLNFSTFATSLGDTSSLAWPIFPTMCCASRSESKMKQSIADLDAALDVVKAAGFWL